MKIYLSPSTQENNIGKGEYGTEEKRMNQLTDIIEVRLKRYGHEIFRNTPTMTLKQAVADSNKHNPDIHVAIHSNASTGKARGAVVFCYKFGGKGEKLARAIYNELEKVTPTKDLGVRESNNHFGIGKPLYETAYTHAPAALIEVDFHDNPEGAKWILENMNEIATAIVTGINNYAGVDNDVNAEYKKIIQFHCKFSYPEGTWEVLDKHKYAHDLYRQWAESYERS
jgi:N-acetylmuramoyl-L-alanine amidase